MSYDVWKVTLKYKLVIFGQISWFFFLSLDPSFLSPEMPVLIIEMFFCDKEVIFFSFILTCCYAIKDGADFNIQILYNLAWWDMYFCLLNSIFSFV